MNGLSNLNSTYVEYSLSPTDELLDSGGQRSRSQQAFNVVNASTSMLIKVHLLELTHTFIYEITKAFL